MKIEHTALYVRDLEGARAFFCTYFGASSGPLYHNPNTGFRSYFLTVGEGDRLELMTRYPVLSGPRTTGDGYYESCVAGVEGIPVEITI